MIKEFTHTGRRHKSANTDNQDYICSGSDRNNTVITLADGVSSCSESRTGARICGDTLTRFLMKKGDLLITFDMDAIKKAGYLLTTPMIICNTDEYSAVKPILSGGEVAVGTPILEVKG